MKLIAGRHKDRTDIIELVKVLADTSWIVEFAATEHPHPGAPAQTA